MPTVKSAYKLWFDGIDANYKKHINMDILNAIMADIKDSDHDLVVNLLTQAISLSGVRKMFVLTQLYLMHCYKTCSDRFERAKFLVRAYKIEAVYRFLDEAAEYIELHPLQYIYYENMIRNSTDGLSMLKSGPSSNDIGNIQISEVSLRKYVDSNYLKLAATHKTIEAWIANDVRSGRIADVVRRNDSLKAKLRKFIEDAKVRKETVDPDGNITVEYLQKYSIEIANKFDVYVDGKVLEKILEIRTAFLESILSRGGL